LERSPAFVDAILNTILDGLLTVDDSGAILSFNRGAKKIFGYTAEEVLGRNVSMLMSEPHRSAHDAYLRRYLLEGNSKVIGRLLTLEGLRKDGSTFPMDLTVTQMRVGGRIAFVGLCRDATPRLKAEEELRRSEERFRKLLQNAPDLLLVLDSDGGVQYVNPASEEILGRSPDSISGTSLLDLLHPEDVAPFTSVLKGAAQVEGEIFFASLRVRKPGGDHAVLEALGTNLLKDPAVRGLVINAKDLTQSQRAVENLRLFHRALASSRNGVVITDPSQPDNPILFVNSAFEEITGYGAAEVTGRNCRFLHGDDADQPGLEEIRRAVLERREGAAVLRNYRKDGTPFWNELQVFPVRDDFGAVTHFVGIQNDITQRVASEEALRRSEAQFKAIFDGSPVGIALVDAEGRPFASNPALCDMLGYSAEELRGLSFADFTDSRDLYLDLKFFKDLMAGRREGYRMEKRYVRKDGAVFWGALNVALARGAKGEPLFAIGMVTDVTQRRESEDALRHRDAVLDASSAAAERLLRGEDWSGSIGEVLDRLGQALMVSGAALYQKPGPECRAERRALWVDPDAYSSLAEQPPPDCRPEWLPRAWISGLEAGEPVSASPAGPEGEFPPDSPWLGRSVAFLPIFAGREWWGVLAIEEIRLVRRWSLAELDMLKTFAGTLGAAIQRQRDLEALQASEARIRSLIDNMLGGLVAFSSRGIIEMVNPSAETIFGYSRDELVGRHVSLLMAVPEGEDPRTFFDGAFGKAIGRVTEWEARRKSGEIFPVELSLFEFRTSAGKSFAGNIQDISQRREVDRLKKEFVSTVSHELRTPLTSIRGSLGLLQGGVAGELPAQAHPLVDIALKNSERLVRLINDILDMEKIEAGRMAFDLREVPLEPLLHQAVEANRGFAHQYGKTIAYEPPPGAGGWTVRVDVDRFQQVVTNLLSNAVKFSPENGTVTLWAEAAGSDVRVSVRDEGPGIPETFRSRIFSKFAQADSSDTRKKGGTGLGLSIAKAIVERMGGAIGFATGAGMGTTFFFTLPIQSAPKVSAGTPRAAGPAGDGPARPMVLHVEDDPDVVEVVRTLVADFAEVVPARTLEEARRALGKSPFDLVILDLTLPDGSGADLLEAVPGPPSSCPVLVFSAEDRGLEAAGRAAAFLVKGATSNDRLRSAIGDLLGRDRSDGPGGV
jgi:PAS domain S-box-containing protein